MLAELALVPLVLLIVDGERLLRRARWPLVALLAITLLLTLTRTLLAVPVALLLPGLIGVEPRKIPRALAIALLVALAIVSMRVDVHGRGEPGIRWRIAGSALAHAAAHPLLGVGPARAAAQAGWPSATDPVFDWDAHSTVLDVAATTGVPALLCLVALLALVLRSGWRAPREATQVALLCGLLATLFDAITVDVEDFRHLWLLLGLTSAQRWLRPAQPREPTG
jgi:O-antigen ligase